MITLHISSVFSQPTEHYSCACGWTSSEYVTRGYSSHDVAPAAAEVREHLADVHGEQLDVGRCKRCGQPTEHFRAVTPHGALYLCETHSPAMSDLDVSVPAP